MQEKCIFWFRRDLRINDNAGLYEALCSGKKVIALFIFDSNILSQLENKSDSRVNFIYQALQTIDLQLKLRGSGLLIRKGDPVEVFSELHKEIAFSAVFTNRDYEPYALKRDQQLTEFLHKKGINFFSFKDQVICEPGDILKNDGTPYTVYTPYAKSWKKWISEHTLLTYPSENETSYDSVSSLQTVRSIEETGFHSTGIVYSDPVVPELLIKNYHATRDYPAIDGTSRLSVHLRFGTISIRKLIKIALKENETWLGELIWREFFMSILYFFPQVTTQAFKPAYDSIPWRNNEEEFVRWCKGTTGYPIVDAGMRELSATGHMHNRVRMIVAGFLTKHLLIDWRWGESWFATHLLDYDLSANNGNWQWAAGCGCDAAPYFRIFNPYEQTKKFDSKLEYSRKWVPEVEEPGYPTPIVEHSFARQRALDTYKRGLK